MNQDTHETFARSDELKIGSDRSFGIVISTAIALIAAYNWWNDGIYWPWEAAIAAVLVLAAIMCPNILHPVNIAWMQFGALLHKVVNPIVMGVIFFGTILPTGLIIRVMRKDVFRLAPDKDAQSYWIKREPPGPAPESMKNQF